MRFADAFPLASDPGPLLADLAATAIEAAEAAAAVLARPRQGAVSGVETKISATDMVSDVDREAEAVVSDVLSARRPQDAVMGEEGTTREGTTGVRWVVDPLDGTTNFLFGVPHFSVSVAAEVDGRAAVGVVLDPCRGETWSSVAGHGAFLNGHRLEAPPSRSTLATALVATGFGYRPEHRRWQAEIAARVLPAVRDIRRFGSAALDLCWTGAGRFDAYYEWGLNPWDLQAGALVAREAGASVEVLPNRLVLAGPAELFADLRALLERSGGLDAPPDPST